MKGLRKGALIAVIHVLIVCSLGVKLLYDRHTRPRVWAQTVPYDPDLPIRGRYLSLQLIVGHQGFKAPERRDELGRWRGGSQRARLEVHEGKLLAVKDDEGEFTVWFTPAAGVTPREIPSRECYKEPVEKRAACTDQEAREQRIDFPVVAVLSEPVAYYIPEHATDPTPRAPSSNELWAEVTIPRKGPPRPIQLALKESGAWKPLDLK